MDRLTWGKLCKCRHQVKSHNSIEVDEENKLIGAGKCIKCSCEKFELGCYKMRNQIKEEIKLIYWLLIQSCEEKGVIDNRCISTYEDACDYLVKKGYLKKINDRTYEVTKKGKKLENG